MKRQKGELGENGWELERKEWEGEEDVKAEFGC